MRLEGSLDAFSLPDIFALLSMTKKSGGLHLRHEGAHGVVCFTAGAITGASSDLTRQALGRRLVGAGHVDDEQLAAAVERVRNEPELGLGRALQQVAGIDDGALHELVSEQVLDAVFDLLRWTGGDFEFVVDEANPDDVGVSRAADEVVADARRRLEAWGGVATSLPSPDTVLSVALAPEGELALSREEWALLALVDGRRTVAQVIALAGRGEFAVASTLAGLVDRGLLRVDDSGGVAALLRRQAVLASLEGRPAEPLVETIEAPSTDPGPEAATADRAASAPALSLASSNGEVPVQPQAPSQPPAPATARSRADVLAEVTPARPEPFLPHRRPEHPEPPTPSAAVTAAVGNTAVATSPSPHIERDPSVNKSLLLRLIAGVRGL